MCGAPQLAARTKMRREVCEIRLWQGYRSYEFFAAVGDVAIAQSDSFRSRGEPSAEDEKARMAHAALVRQLLDEGWQADGTGSGWFSQRFFQLVEDLTPQTVAPPPVPQPEAPSESSAPLREPSPEPKAPEPTSISPSAFAASEQPPAVADDHTDRGGKVVGLLRRREGQVQVLSLIGLLVTLGFGWYVLRDHASAAPRKQPVSAAAHRSQPTAAGSKVVAASAVSRLRIVGSGAGSWVELRSGSHSGRLLFSGRVGDGGVVVFATPRIWGRFGAAGNLQVRLNGRPVKLSGTVDVLFTPRGVRTA